MNILFIDIIGFAAAIITNISFYPQAYEVYLLVNKRHDDKLNAISLITFGMTGFGCTLWLIYASVLHIFPMILGSILTIVPSIYICSVLILNKFFHNNSSRSSKIHETHEISTDNSATNMITAPNSIQYSSTL